MKKSISSYFNFSDTKVEMRNKQPKITKTKKNPPKKKKIHMQFKRKKMLKKETRKKKKRTKRTRMSFLCARKRQRKERESFRKFQWI
jgi:hypothetical protein